MTERLGSSSLVVAVLAFALGQGVASAQSGPGAATPTTLAGTPRMSLDQMVEQGKGLLATMTQRRSTVAKQLEAARTAKDVVKTLCTNDKLNQVDVAVRSATERQTQLEGAARRNDVELATHEYSVIVVLSQRNGQLVADAYQCIGEEAAFVGESAVISQIDPGIPGVDPTMVSDVIILAEPPACSSCIR